MEQFLFEIFSFLVAVAALCSRYKWRKKYLESEAYISKIGVEIGMDQLRKMGVLDAPRKSGSVPIRNLD